MVTLKLKKVFSPMWMLRPNSQVKGGADPAGVRTVGEEVAADLLAQDVIPRR
jgi:hypothetical protein